MTDYEFIETCDICGEEIEGNSYYREDKNEYICEECYVNWLKKKGKRKNVDSNRKNAE